MSEENSENPSKETLKELANETVEPSSSPDTDKYADKWKNEYLYLRAEFENYKKNTIKERSDLIKFGSERLIVDVLGVLDNFERALATDVNAENWKNFVTGVQMTAQELKTALTRFGLSEVPSLGKEFNPIMHEALSSEETEDLPEGHITRVFKKAYKLHDRVIRPGQVVVAKKSENA